MHGFYAVPAKTARLLDRLNKATPTKQTASSEENPKTEMQISAQRLYVCPTIFEQENKATGTLTSTSLHRYNRAKRNHSLL
jgi:hypothetical protein